MTSRVSEEDAKKFVKVGKDAEAAWAAEGDKAAWADLSDFINPQKTDKAASKTGWAARGMANQCESRRRHYTADGGSF